MALDFLGAATDVVLVGPNGVDRSTLAQNIADRVLIHGHTVPIHQRRPAAWRSLPLDSGSALRSRLHR